MIVLENDIYRDATPEEIAALVAAPPPEPTDAEKIAALLAAIEGGIKDA